MFGWRIIDCLTSIAANCCRPGLKMNHELTLSSLGSVGMKIRCIASGRCPNMESAPFGHLRLTDRENQTMRLLDASVLNGNFIQTKQTNWDLSIFRCQVGKGPGFVPGFAFFLGVWPSDTKNITKRWLTFSMTGRALVGLGFQQSNLKANTSSAFTL